MRGRNFSKVEEFLLLDSSTIKIIANLYKNKKTIILNVFYLSFNKEKDTDMILYNLSRYKNGDSI